MFTALILSASLGAAPEDEQARAAVAVEVAKLRTNPIVPAVVTPDAIPVTHAPPGSEWVRYPGGPWQLRPLAPVAASGVAAPAHFPAGFPTTPRTAAPPVAATSIGYPAPVPSVVPTFTPARRAIPGSIKPWSGSYGVTGCATGG